MSADNVTPIRPRAESPPAGPKRPRSPKGAKCKRFHLAERAGEPDNVRLIGALHGVCKAIEEQTESCSGPPPLELAMAAEILSAILMDRMDFGAGD